MKPDVRIVKKGKNIIRISVLCSQFEVSYLFDGKSLLLTSKADLEKRVGRVSIPENMYDKIKRSAYKAGRDYLKKERKKKKEPFLPFLKP